MLASGDYVLTQFGIPPSSIQIPEELLVKSQTASEYPLVRPLDGDLKPYVIKQMQEALTTLERLDHKHEVIFQPGSHTEKMTKRFIKLINGLKILQLHFDFLLELLTAESPDEFPNITKKFDPLSNCYRPIAASQDICLHSLSETFEHVVYFLLDEIEKATDNFFLPKGDGTFEIKSDKVTIAHVQILASKLETTLEYFPGAVSLLPDDVFAHARTSDVWKSLYQSCESIVIGDKEAIKNQYKSLYTVLRVANAMLYKSEKATVKSRFSIALSGIYYGAKKQKAELNSSLFLSDPKMESAFQVWNFIEKGWVREIMKLALPTIDYDKKFYIHRLFPSINRETILREYEEGTINKIVENTFKPIDLSSKKDLILETIFNKQADVVKMRIISPFPLVLQGLGSEKARAMAMKAVNSVNRLFSKNKSELQPDGIIFHIHGGGFVSGSTSTHRNYLYRWAKSLKKIIFSVDYRLAPDYPYPAAVDDVWQAYNWVVNYAEPILGIKTNKIILAGDSAGGNLVMALALRTIKMGVRIPDGCMLAYPALNLYPQMFVPSYYLALEDTVLPYSLLKLCLKAYVPDECKPEMDPFLSPVYAGDELLEKLPPVRIMTGTDDPLHDDNWRFLQKMQRLNKDIKMVVYENMPHGFLSFDTIEDYKTILEGTCKVFTELFGDAEREPLSPDQIPKKEPEQVFNASEEKFPSEVKEGSEQVIQSQAEIL